MLSCSSQQTVGRGETFSQIDFCLPEKPCRPDPTSGRAESDSLIPCLLGGRFPFGQWFAEQRRAEERARRRRGPRRPVAGPCPRPQAAVGPVTGTAEKAPRGASWRTRRPRRLCRSSEVSLIHFLAFLSFFLHSSSRGSVGRVSVVDSVTVDAATNVKGRLVRS